MLNNYGDPLGKTVAIFVGPGNNGGDGFLIARHLANLENSCKVLLFADPELLALFEAKAGSISGADRSAVIQMRVSWWCSPYCGFTCFRWASSSRPMPVSPMYSTCPLIQTDALRTTIYHLEWEHQQDFKPCNPLQAASRRRHRAIGLQAGSVRHPAAAAKPVRAQAGVRRGLGRGDGLRGAGRLRPGGGDRSALYPLYVRHHR